MVVGRTADVDLMRTVFADQKLPADLVFIALVESALHAGSASPAGAVGPWQFTAPTAKAFGLRVDGAIDERTDLRKSTGAAARYIRELILDFGAGGDARAGRLQHRSGAREAGDSMLRGSDQAA